MKKLSILPALAVAISSLATPACNPKVTEIRGETGNAATAAIEQEELTDAPDYWRGECLYEKNLYKVKSYLKSAQRAEREGWFENAAHLYWGWLWDAADAYRMGGDKAKAKELKSRAKRESAPESGPPAIN